MGKNAVTKIVIPAAGLGTRFLPMTKTQPKEMLPVVDKPVIQYVVEEAVLSGIDDIIIITGKGKRAIEDHFDSSFELEWKLEQKDPELYQQVKKLSELADIHFIRQKHQNGLGDAVLTAEKHCGDEPFAVLLGDTITIPNAGQKTCTKQMLDVFDKYQESIVVVEQVPDYKIPDFGIIDGTIIEDGVYQINDIVEKPALENAPSNLGAIGRYIFTPEIFDYLKETRPGYGGEIQLTDAIGGLENKLGLVTKCTRYDIGDKLGWMKSSLKLALEHEEFAGPLKKYMKKLYEEGFDE